MFTGPEHISFGKMDKTERSYAGFIFLLFIASLIFGILSALAFLYPSWFKEHMPFQQLRPMHVSAVMFWLISAASFNIFLHNKRESRVNNNTNGIRNAAILLWVITIIIIYIHYTLNKFGGREYWEFPGWISILLLLSWCGFCYQYYQYWKHEKDKRPQYIIMWATGMLFFLLTFIEQNLWQISWFRQSFLQEMTVQWKANGSMVGAWNQMIYGLSFFLMVKISGNKKMAYDSKAIVFYFLGFTNLLFNWGHHIYNLPIYNWIRHVSYIISMTEWVLLINIIQNFRKTLEETRKYRHLITYRFIVASEFWVFLNLLLALFMSIPSVNRYTHGTHITVAHAMGTTIGINTMILLASFADLFGLENLKAQEKRTVSRGFYIIQASLLVFWFSLIAAGIFEGYQETYLGHKTYASVIPPVMTCMKLVLISGVGLLAGFIMMLGYFLRGIRHEYKPVTGT